MTVTDTTPRTRPFYLITAPSGVHTGSCLVACGADRHDLPPVRGSQYRHVFASRTEAAETYPEWEEEIMSS